MQQKKRSVLERKLQPIEPKLTGDEAEDFVEYLGQKLFLKPWVFKNPKYKEKNSHEFSDVVIMFKDTLFLIEVKGNKFDPAQPQRYMKEAKCRHRQLKRAEKIVKNKSKTVIFKNDFFEFESDFSEIKTVHLISVSTGLGEMEIASGSDHINYSKLDSDDMSKYLGFYDHESKIHSFTGEELVYASKHLDTVKDFSWYLDFEKKYLSNEFSTEGKQSIIAVVHTHREDLISIYTVNYYWDENLNTTGEIDLNVIFGDADISKADMILYTGSDTRNYMADDQRYQEIMSEREISYFWDHLINNVIAQFEFGYKVTGSNPKRQPIDSDELKGVLERMSNTSRFERVEFSRKMNQNLSSNCFRNMFTNTRDSDVMFSFMNTVYDSFPDQAEQNNHSERHLYSAWCRIKYGSNLAKIKDRINEVLLVTRHSYKGCHAYSFALTTEIKVEEDVCKKLGLTH